jgi:hypothetical protein
MRSFLAVGSSSRNHCCQKIGRRATAVQIRQVQFVVPHRNGSPRLRNHQLRCRFGYGSEFGRRFVSMNVNANVLPGDSGFSCSHQRQNDICAQIHQETFGDPACALSRIEAAFDKRLFIESGGVQINCDKMQSTNANLRKGPQFVTLRRRMINLPKLRISKILM